MKLSEHKKLLLVGGIILAVLGVVICLWLVVYDDERLVEYVPVVKRWHHNVPELVDAPELDTPEFRRILARQLIALGVPYEIGDGGLKIPRCLIPNRYQAWEFTQNVLEFNKKGKPDVKKGH